jgi:hypothetical protein
MPIERDKELKIWTYSPGHARHFFGFPEDRPVRVLKEQPTTAEEIERYEPNAKLFAVLAYNPPADYVAPPDGALTEDDLEAILDGTGDEPLDEQLRRLNGTVPTDEWELEGRDGEDA